MILKTRFPVKVRDIQRIEKNNPTSISVFSYENKEKHPIYVWKKCSEEKHLNLILIEKKNTKYNMFLSKILIHSCKNIIYIMGKTFSPLLCKIVLNIKISY